MVRIEVLVEMCDYCQSDMLIMDVLLNVVGFVRLYEINSRFDAC